MKKLFERRFFKLLSQSSRPAAVNSPAMCWSSFHTRSGRWRSSKRRFLKLFLFFVLSRASAHSRGDVPTGERVGKGGKVSIQAQHKGWTHANRLAFLPFIHGHRAWSQKSANPLHHQPHWEIKRTPNDAICWLSATQGFIYLFFIFIFISISFFLQVKTQGHGAGGGGL